MDCRRGAQLFKFDMSLMERLAGSGLSMSRLDVQRRMRPTISALIRLDYVELNSLPALSDSPYFNSNTLYMGLVDHELVKGYPSVRGFASNVFFFTHTNKENGGAEESASKYNAFEVRSSYICPQTHVN